MRIGGAAAAALLALAAVVACGDDGTGPGQPPRITILPEGPLALYIGDTVTVRATIRNLVNTGVSYSSTAPEVVAIDEVTGLATALSPGEATLSGVSAVDPRINAQVAVTVMPDLPAAVTLGAMRTPEGGEVDPAKVSGALALGVAVTAGNARRLEVRLGEEVVCQQEYSPPQPQDPPPELAVAACTFDTAAFDPQSGAPRFVNGDLPLIARLVGSADRLLASSDAQTLTLTNGSIVAGSVAPERTAVDAGGGSWVGGSLVVTAVPVLYDADAAVEAVTLDYTSPAGRDTTAVDAAAPFQFTLPAAGILAGITDPALRVALTSKDPDGAAGPEGTTLPLRYDGTPPTPGAFLPREWIGAQTRFVDTYSAEDESDSGVGRVHLNFFAGDPALGPEALVAGGVPVTVGSDLSQAARGAYRVVARVCDGLDNCALLDGYLFGVDLTPPIVESVSIADRSANPGADMVVGVRDDLSGFPDRLLEVAVRLLDASPGTAACGPMVESVDLPGKPLGEGCAPDTVANPVRVPRTTAGYYSYSLVAFDRAGNRSTQIGRSILVDLQAPHIGPVTVSTPLEPGGSAMAAAEVDDDVEVAEVEFTLVFPSPSAGAAIAIPFAAATPLGIPFDATLVTEADASASLPVVRTLTYGGPSTSARTTVLLDSIRGTVRDGAGLASSSARRIAPAQYGGDTSTADPFYRYSGTGVSVDRNAVCTGGCTSNDPTTVRISVRVEGESGTGIPFAQIHFYRREPGGRMIHVGSRPGGEVTITNAGNRSTYVYTLDLTPPVGLSGEFEIAAVGVNSRGNAITTPLGTAPRVTFYSR